MKRYYEYYGPYGLFSNEPKYQPPVYQQAKTIKHKRKKKLKSKKR